MTLRYRSIHTAPAANPTLDRYTTLTAGIRRIDPGAGWKTDYDRAAGTLAGVSAGYRHPSARRTTSVQTRTCSDPGRAASDHDDDREDTDT